MIATIQCSAVSEGTAEGTVAVDRETEFCGQPVFSEIAFTHTDEPGQEPEIRALTRWAVCLYRDSDDPAGWVTAEVIGLPGVASEGATRDEALANVREALQCAVEATDAADAPPLRREYRIPAGGEVIYLSL